MEWKCDCQDNIKDLIILLENYDNNDSTQEEIFDLFCSAFGIDDFIPQIVNKREYMYSDGIVLYRGYDSSLKDFSLYKEEFLKGKYQRYSRSVLGKGMCFSDDKSIIREYSNLAGKIFGANTIKCKLSENAKLIQRNYLKVEFSNRYRELLERIQNYLKCNINVAKTLLTIASDEDNNMMRAVLCGYDGLAEQYNDGKKVFVIYNRACFKVLVKKYNKIR